jgi:hypothetical protein
MQRLYTPRHRLHFTHVHRSLRFSVRIALNKTYKAKKTIFQRLKLALVEKMAENERNDEKRREQPGDRMVETHLEKVQ